jgi:hypothetical protein
VNGKKHGRGRFQWMNGKTKEISESYDGEFKDDLFDGVGTYIWHDGRQYEGTWK